MPCAMGDVGRTTTINGGEAPKDVVYRPLHLLPGFKFSGEDWVDRGLKDQHDLTELPIDLLAGFTRTWQGLGFDKGKVPDRTFAKSSKEYQFHSGSNLPGPKDFLSRALHHHRSLT